ncbi:sulfite exporter TauE/SafE family protein [Microbacterium sp. H1-D42]|uniref:sulfite exporter TauE/SafE family protein n=1 Tax=Microbacterium sp. H1-D42 TaxID=2925844 RepID=UPI001F53A844|nr:sulfite exporter TauE/SafE family protein [Microbacterium sp. H1-D42]UNK71942.1 sulfite exporter TauE/SafE family protein [Microbacterium sp. H1-D42]
MLVLTAAVTVLAAVIQRVTGLAFVLVLIGPIVLAYGPVEGVTVAVLLAVIASLFAVPGAWREVDWPRTLWLLGAGMLAAPLGALTASALPEPALLLLIGGMGVLALSAQRLGPIARHVRGRPGAIGAGAVAGFMHASSGLSGPALASFALGDDWPQRRFAASAQIIFLGYGAVSVALRGLPTIAPADLLVLGACTAAGMLAGVYAARRVPPSVARRVMLLCAWAGTLVVLVRAIIAFVV